VVPDRIVTDLRQISERILPATWLQKEDWTAKAQRARRICFGAPQCREKSWRSLLPGEFAWAGLQGKLVIYT